MALTNVEATGTLRRLLTALRSVVIMPDPYSQTSPSGNGNKPGPDNSQPVGMRLDEAKLPPLEEVRYPRVRSFDFLNCLVTRAVKIPPAE